MAGGPLNSVMQHLRRLAGSREAEALADSLLLDRFVHRNDPEAFATLLHRHGPMVLSVCRSILQDPHDTEDAFQATFLVLVRRAGAIGRRELLANWLYGVAYRVALRARAKRGRRRERERSGVEMTAIAAGADAHDPDLGPLLHDEVNRLPDKYRQPVVLCYLQGRTQAEAARLLGWTVGMVRGRLERARERLRGRLSRRGLTLSAGLFATVLARQAAPAAVPPALLESTARFAQLVAGGGTALAGVISADVNAHAQGVLAMMRMNTMRKIVFWLAVSCASLGTGVAVYRTLAAEQQTAREESPPPTRVVAAPAPQEPKPRDKAPQKAEPETTPLTVRGTATDTAGKPVRGAAVYLVALDWLHPITVIGKTTTDEQGRYTIANSKLPFSRPKSDPPQSRFQVFGTAPGYGFTWHGYKIVFPLMPRPPDAPTNDTDIVFQGETPVVNLTFGPAASLRGRVVGETDQPLAGVNIQIIFCGHLRFPKDAGSIAGATDFQAIDALPESMRTTSTDREGRFHLDGLPKEICFSIRVSHPDYQKLYLYAATTDQPLPEDIVMEMHPKPGKDNPVWTGDLDLKLIPPRQVTVQMVDADTGKPAAGVRVAADQYGRTQTGDEGTTDREGKVTLRLPPGQYHLSASPPRDADYLKARRIDLSVGKTGGETVRVKLSPACVVVLQAVDADTGKGIPGVAFQSEDVDHPGQWNRVQHSSVYWDNPVTDASGKLRVIFPPGKRRFSAAPLTWQNGYQLPKGYKLIKDDTAPVELSPGKEVKLRFEFRKEAPASGSAGKSGDG